MEQVKVHMTAREILVVEQSKVAYLIKTQMRGRFINNAVINAFFNMFVQAQWHVVVTPSQLYLNIEEVGCWNEYTRQCKGGYAD